MQYSYISGRAGTSERLILIFAGWGMDARPFSALRRAGYDIAVVWDYRDCVLPADIVSGYKEICVIAWSMGVMVADGLLDSIPAVTLSVAVNGTTCPVDNSLGIPEAIFDGTLAGLSERTLEKFRMRMCGGAHAYAEFKPFAPLRSFDELRDELEALGRIAKSRRSGGAFVWDHAIVSMGDAIFPPENQMAAWKDKARSLSVYRGPHMPNFQELLDHFVMNKEIVVRRFERSTDSYRQHAVAQSEIADELAALIRRCGLPSSPQILEIGCGTGLLSVSLGRLAEESGGELELWDIVDSRPIPGVPFRCVDAETEIRDIPDGKYSLISSSSTIQWFNSPARFIREAMRALRPGGLLALSTFAMGNLVEVAQATGIFLPLMSEKDWRRTVDGLGEVLAIYTKRKILYFDNPVKVFRHLKNTGVNALSAKEPLLKSLDRYPREADGSCRLTYLPIFILLRKNGKTQQT